MLNYCGEFFGGVIWRFGSGNEEFDGCFKGRSDLECFVSIRKPFSGHPILKGTKADSRGISDPFLCCVLFFYKLFNIRPKYVHGFHTSSITKKYRHLALLSLDYNAVRRYNLIKYNVN